jgi:hypothetical protein
MPEIFLKISLDHADLYGMMSGHKGEMKDAIQ